MKNNFVYLTTNNNKIDEIKFHFSRYDMEVMVEKPNIEILETQGTDCLEVAKFSAKYAADKLNKAVLKSDTGVYIDVLGGLPGCYNSNFAKQIGHEKLITMINAITKDDKPARIRLQHCFAYCEPGKDPIGFEGGSEGTVARKCEGSMGGFHDFFFIPDGQEHTLSYLREKNGREMESKFWGDAIDQFITWYKNQ
ncbi:MAG: non-canonical purine NTP pyrophosphatase [Patescibacteria group bacterium]